MSSLLAYGHGFLSEDIGSGVGLTEPWAQGLGWSDGEIVKGPAPGESREDSSVIPKILQPQAGELGSGGGSGGGLSQFFDVIQAGAPPPHPEPQSQDLNELLEAGLVRSSTKDLLHWDSPPQSPISSFVHLPLAVLTTVAAGTKADVMLVGMFEQENIGSNRLLEIFFSLPKGLGIPEYVVFKPEMLACVTGKLISTENTNLPAAFTHALGGPPQAFLASRFNMQTYDGIILGLWRDFSQVTPTVEAVFADSVKCLPLMLSNRFNVKKYERLSRRFDAILKVIPDAVLFVDVDDAQVVLNPAAATLLGLPNHGEVDPHKVALAMRTLTERCNTRTDPQHWTRLLSKEEEMEIEEDWELMMPRRVLHVRSYPVVSRTAHGRLWIYEDVTSQRDAELAMETANKAKSQFLAMMSHELRTPMTGVLGMLDLLHLTNLEEEQQMLVKIMQESAEGLMDVINNILDYCKIEAGRLQLEEIDYSFPEMLEQIQAMLKTSLLKKALKVTFPQGSYGTNIVRGDPVRLRQIVLNLISNAIKFTEDGSVSVSYRFLDPQWEDTTVVATSQASSGKSRLINQIINASRGEKCTVEHSTTEAGRTLIVVNFSSAGAAGPYLESSSMSGLRSSSVRPSSNAGHQELGVHPSAAAQPSNASAQSSGSHSFPVSYSFQPEDEHLVSAPLPSQVAETRYSFTERTSIAGKECSGIPGASSSLPSSSQGTPSVTWVGSTANATPYTNTARSGKQCLQVDEETSHMDEGDGLRPSKHRRLTIEGARGPRLQQQAQQTSLSASHTDSSEQQQLWEHEYPGIDTYPKWLTALSSPGALKSPKSSFRNSSEDSSSRSSPSRKRNEPLRNEDEATFAREGEFQMIRRSGSASMTGGLYQDGGDGNPESGEETREEKRRLNPQDRVWLEIKIEDTGVGIGQDQLQRLFVGSHVGSERRNAGGTGLGLSIVKGLLCLMNGKIQIDSKIGEGTTVLMTIPLLPAANEHLNDAFRKSDTQPSTGEGETSQPEQNNTERFSSDPKSPERNENRARPARTSSPAKARGEDEPCPSSESVGPKSPPSPAKAPPTHAHAHALGSALGKDMIKKSESSARSVSSPEIRQLSILVAEDNKINQLLIRKMFQHLGLEHVEMVGNGKLAIEAVQRSRFDLVLMDVQMPILDGLSAVKAIRGLPPPKSQLPIYALSADAPGSGPLSETGLDGYLRKPIVWSTMSELLARIAASGG